MKWNRDGMSPPPQMDHQVEHSEVVCQKMGGGSGTAESCCSSVEGKQRNQLMEVQRGQGAALTHSPVWHQHKKKENKKENQSTVFSKWKWIEVWWLCYFFHRTWKQTKKRFNFHTSELNFRVQTRQLGFDVQLLYSHRLSSPIYFNELP